MKARTAWRPTPLLVPAEARDALLAQAVEAEERGHWYGSEPLGALDLYMALAEADPPMPEAQVGRDRIITMIGERFETERVAGRGLRVRSRKCSDRIVSRTPANRPRRYSPTNAD